MKLKVDRLYGPQYWEYALVPPSPTPPDTTNTGVNWAFLWDTLELTNGTYAGFPGAFVPGPHRVYARSFTQGIGSTKDGKTTDLDDDGPPDPPPDPGCPDDDDGDGDDDDDDGDSDDDGDDNDDDCEDDDDDEEDEDDWLEPPTSLARSEGRLARPSWFVRRMRAEVDQNCEFFQRNCTSD